MAMSQVPLVGVPGYDRSIGVPFHGHRSTVASTIIQASTDNEIPLYEAGSTVLITLGANDRVVITDIAVATGGTMRVTVLSGGSTATTGEIVGVYGGAVGGSGSAGLNSQRFCIPHFCIPGKLPRMLSTTTVTICEVTLHGYVERG